MPVTYKKIASVTVGSGGAASIDFTSIPQTFTDLLIKVSARSTIADNVEGLLIRPNSATTNQSSRVVFGDGSGASSGTTTNIRGGLVVGSTSTSNTFSNNEILIPNYAGATNKSFSYDGVSENNATSAYQELGAMLWQSTAAITSITLVTQNANNFVQYSTATLYGIKKS